VSLFERSPARRRRRAGLFWPLAACLTALFVLRYAHWDLAADDAGWLRGEAPTALDEYRVVPRLTLGLLHALVGPSPVAVLLLSLVLHLSNGWLVLRVARLLGLGWTAGHMAAALVLVNPLTLSTLTWFSCFSYVQGTTFALLALAMAFGRWHGAAGAWRAAAILGLYAGALHSTHEAALLPVVILALRACRRRGERLLGPASVTSVVAALLGVLLQRFGHGFHHWGIGPWSLADLGIWAALVSSTPALAAGLASAYPFSFLGHTASYLKEILAEPVRWCVAVALLGAGVVAWRSSRRWRLTTGLAVTFAAFAAPYVARLYLMPRMAGYEWGYVLAGRVFYLAWIPLALGLGALSAGWLARTRRAAWIGHGIGGFAYLSGLAAYTPSDFGGFNVVRAAGGVAPRMGWNPFVGAEPALLLLVPVAAVAGLWIRRRGGAVAICAARVVVLMGLAWLLGHGALLAVRLALRLPPVVPPACLYLALGALPAAALLLAAARQRTAAAVCLGLALLHLLAIERVPQGLCGFRPYCGMLALRSASALAPETIGALGATSSDVPVAVVHSNDQQILVRTAQGVITIDRSAVRRLAPCPGGTP